jgi:hypothetical protein
VSNANPGKFTRAELADIYEKIVLFYELHNGMQAMNISTRTKAYRKLINEIQLDVNLFKNLTDLANAEIPPFDYANNFIWFHDAKKNTLKSILYHLRNSAAHADIKRQKDKQWWYNDSEKYEYNPNDLKDWKFLDLN